MKILGYRGLSLVSKAIRWQTRSDYSHVAVWLDDESVIEAWHEGGVRRIPYPEYGHTKGTPIDVFSITVPFNARVVEDFLFAQIGKKYDFRSIARFLTRRHDKLNDAWFCNELAEYAVRESSVYLLTGNPSERPPGVTLLSPLLKKESTING